jgi:hypothetical protein
MTQRERESLVNALEEVERLAGEDCTCPPESPASPCLACAATASLGFVRTYLSGVMDMARSESDERVHTSAAPNASASASSSAG